MLLWCFCEKLFEFEVEKIGTKHPRENYSCWTANNRAFSPSLEALKSINASNGHIGICREGVTKTFGKHVLELAGGHCVETGLSQFRKVGCSWRNFCSCHGSITMFSKKNRVLEPKNFVGDALQFLLYYNFRSPLGTQGLNLWQYSQQLLSKCQSWNLQTFGCCLPPHFSQVF